MPRSAIAALLKSTTREAHEAIERSTSMSGLLDSRLDRTAYREHIARMYGFVAPVEARLWAEPGWQAWVPDADARRKTAWLQRDLDALGLGEAPSRCEALPAVSTTAQALGVAYVLEGATLGGAIIGRHLQRTLGLTAEDGAAYYHSYGPERGARWLRFQRALDDYGTTHPDAAPDLCRAAVATFTAMHRWMEAATMDLVSTPPHAR